MNTTEMMTNFARHARSNDFYAVASDFFEDYREHILCTVFYRPSGERRDRAYCLAAYQFRYDAHFCCVEKGFHDLLDTLRKMNLPVDHAIWQEIGRSQLSHHIASSDSGALWRNGYGICRLTGTFQTANFTAWAGCDIAF
jgi:hypothetical protein